MPRETGDGRQPLIGEKHDLNAARMGLFGEADQALLIAANVKDHEDIALAHVDQPVPPVAFLSGEVKDVRPDDRQVRRHVAGDWIREASADEERLGAPIGQLSNNLAKLFVGDVAECFADFSSVASSAGDMPRRLGVQCGCA